MGLDMYLNRQISPYINGLEGDIVLRNEKGNEVRWDASTLNELSEEVAYWRKANQIHHWFVVNVQDGEDDCRPYDVDISQLKELKELCEKVLEMVQVQSTKDGFRIKNVEEIAGLLPTSGGFFFGSTEYDEDYLQDLRDTVNQLTKVILRDEELKLLGVNYIFYEYRASW